MTDKKLYELKYNKQADKRGDFYFIEVNGDNTKSGMLYKYVFIFNKEEKNITLEMSEILNRKISKSLKYYSAIYTTGYGFYFTDYLYSDIKRILK